MVTRESSAYWKLAAIMAAGAALRLYHLDHQSLWHDEAISVIVSRAPLGRILDYFETVGSKLPFEYNPPVYAYVLHGWFKVFGVGGFEARLLSAVAGVLALPLIFLLARRLFGTTTGLRAALLLAVSQIGVMFSQEARNYELFLLLALTTAYLYWTAMTHRSLAAWCACTVSAVLMVLTQYYGVFVILALACHTALYWRSIRLMWVAGAAVAGASAVAPWLRFAFAGQVGAASDRVQPEYFAVGLSSVAGTINRFNNGAVNGLLESAPWWTFAAGAVLFGGPIAVLLVQAWQNRPRESEADSRGRFSEATVFALLLGTVPLAAVLALGAVLNVQYNVRYVAFCIAPYYILAAAGLTRLPGAWLRHLALVAIVAYSGYALTANYRVPYKENYRDAIGFVAGAARPGDCYAFVPFGAPPLSWSIYASDSPAPAPRLAIDGNAEAAACRRIWAITYQRVTMESHARWREWLAKATAAHTRIADRSFFWVRVELYAAASRTATGPRSPGGIMGSLD
jgi:4-amino-4-deoxy-L-arabinose transferase-like glycosyltransferase